jgi:hypothetical protein
VTQLVKQTLSDSIQPAPCSGVRIGAEFIFGWAMWSVFLAATVIYWAEIGFDILSGRSIFLSDGFRALACTLLTSWFLLIPEWDKLHLFWLAFSIITIGDWIEYRRVPPFIRAMRHFVGPQPIKHKPSPQINWTHARQKAVNAS